MTVEQTTTPEFRCRAYAVTGRRSVDAVAAGLAPDASELAYLTDWLHRRRMHPDWEYETLTGQRKAWPGADDPPPGEGWELNITAEDPEAWERFDYHEERYWRRRKP